MMYPFDTPKEKRVVIYARVSTEHEAQVYALGNQLEWYNAFLERHPEWILVDKYIDEGITGTSAEKRPGFTQMISDAHEHKFDLIITREVSRFARNTEETLHFTKALRRVGVEVFFINDGIKTFDGDGELRLSLMASLAQEESRKTSIRVKSGQQVSMNNGVFYGNGNILGYDRVGKDLVINPEQAETVRMIYDMYLAGDGLMKIKDELERRGRLTSMGKTRWHCTVISHVLQNTFYCGIITYHKEYVENYLDQKKTKNYGEIELTQVQGTHTPIVSVDEYERVQKIMATKRGEMKNLNSGRKPKGKTPPKTVWGKLLVCECGHKFNRVKWSGSGENTKYAYQCYYVINHGSYESRKKRGLPLEDACRSPMIPEWKLDLMAKFIFDKFLSDKQRVLAIAESVLRKHYELSNEKTDNSELIARKEALLKDLKQRYDSLIDMCADGIITKDDLAEKIEPIKKQMTAVNNELADLAPARYEPIYEDYEEKITFLRYALDRYTYPENEGDVPPYVIEALIKKIVVTPHEFKWYLRFGKENEPIDCEINGKRAENCSLSVDSEEISPSALEQYRQQSKVDGERFFEDCRVNNRI